MSEEMCFTELVRHICGCVHDPNAWLLGAVWLAAAVAVLRRLLRAKTIQARRCLGPVARWLRSELGTVLLAFAGGAVASIVGWCTACFRPALTACELGAMAGATAIWGLLAVGVLAAVRALCGRSRTAPTAPPSGDSSTQPGIPPGVWCPPDSRSTTSYRA